MILWGGVAGCVWDMSGASTRASSGTCLGHWGSLRYPRCCMHLWCCFYVICAAQCVRFYIANIIGWIKLYDVRNETKRIEILLCSIWNVESFDCKNFSSFSQILLLFVAFYTPHHFQNVISASMPHFAYVGWFYNSIDDHDPTFLNVVNGLKDKCEPDDFKLIGIPDNERTVWP